MRGAPRVALISHGLWVRRYGADPGVVGRTLSLETSRGPVPQVPIIGVLPPDFEMPVEAADILLPAAAASARPEIPVRAPVMTFARLKPDVTPERAEADAGARSGRRCRRSRRRRFRAAWQVQPLHDRRIGDAARVAWLLIGAVAIFLLIACVNVTNLMLARVAERQREFAVRAAVGAGKIRLARLALAESLLLSLAAGGVGLLGGLRAPAGRSSRWRRRHFGIAEASIDVRVFVVAVVLSSSPGWRSACGRRSPSFAPGGCRGCARPARRRRARSRACGSRWSPCRSR